MGLRPDFDWRPGTGAALRLFLIPSDLVGGGVSGLAQLIHHYTKFPIGLMVLIGNVPLFVLGWQYSGGPKFAFRTIVKIVAFSILTDTLVFFLPIDGVTDDMVLNTVYGGLLLGVGLESFIEGEAPAGDLIF